MTKASANRETAFGGQLLMVGLPGPKVEPVARELVRDLKVGGIILFARNLESPEQVWQLTHDLQREAREAGSPPLLIALDQEGGPVQRLKAPFTLIPAARELGLTATPEEVEDLARRVGLELALVGVNMNLAPVLDVPRSPACPQWHRAYSSDPERAARYALAAIRGYLAGGVIPVAKHFPGLGDTVVDSHQMLPSALSADAQREVDLLPFREAAAAGVPAVMTAHLLVHAWDSRPATLSAVALQEWLRQKLGFQGVVITDDLEMGAIAGRLPVAQAAQEALAAGADLLLICNNWGAAKETARLLAADTGLTARAGESAARVARLRRSLPAHGSSLDEVRHYFQSK
ncbi:MAG: beta-N-acetylhexosaminidase [Deltaproteobacteria bacterium]|nr:beta-N-acetylhexosaminidase [Deltaproteobacteria bacterium]